MKTKNETKIKKLEEKIKKLEEEFQDLEKLEKYLDDRSNIDIDSLNRLASSGFLDDITNVIILEIWEIWSNKIDKQLPLTIDFVIDINDSKQLKSESNKNYYHFVKDINTLEGAVKNPYTSYYETNIEILTEIFYRLVKNHPFNDGNKRTALVSVSLYIINSMFNILSTEIDYKIVNNIIDIIFKDTDRIVALMVSIANTNQLNNDEGVNRTKEKISAFIRFIIIVSFNTINN